MHRMNKIKIGMHGRGRDRAQAVIDDIKATGG
jgi:hypothetical protein